MGWVGRGEGRRATGSGLPGLSPLFQSPCSGVMGRPTPQARGVPGSAAPCRGVPRPGRTILGGGASDTGLGSEPRPASRSLGRPVQLHGAAGCSLTAAAPVTRPRARADLPCALREAVGRGGEGAVLGGPGPCPPRGPPPQRCHGLCTSPGGR